MPSRSERLAQRERILQTYDQGPHTIERRRETERLLATLDGYRAFEAYRLKPANSTIRTLEPLDAQLPPFDRVLSLHARQYSPSDIGRLTGCPTVVVERMLHLVSTQLTNPSR